MLLVRVRERSVPYFLLCVRGAWTKMMVCTTNISIKQNRAVEFVIVDNHKIRNIFF